MSVNESFSVSTSPFPSSKNQSRYACPICTQSFGRSEHLERHIAAHKGSRPWICEYCRSRFSRKDVMYRHHNTCQAAHDAGYRRGTVPKKSKRRSCERCSRLKCKCDDQSPCGRCAAAGVECQRSAPVRSAEEILDEEDALSNIHLLAHHASQTPKEILSPQVISPEAFPNSMQTAQALQFHDPFQHHGSVTMASTESSIPFDWGLFDTNIGTMDNLLPDTDEILREMFKTLNHPQTNSEQVDSGAIIPDPTVDEQLCDWNSVSIAMNKIDPLETHRLTINQHLLHSGTVSRDDIAWLSPHNVREMVYCFFRHFHRHTPIVHLPTWDIATTPSSLLLAMILLGAVYSDHPEKHAPHARRIAREAKSLVYKLDQGLTDGPNPTLESIQALYLLACFSTFYVGMEECRKTRQEYPQLIDLARNSGLFRTLQTNDNPCNKAWEEWVYEERRKRTAFLIYLLDCGHVLFFGDRPRVAPYELRHSLPAHEHVYEARTAFEWQIASTATNQAEYPVLLEMLLSPQIERHPSDISVFGNFLLLHGIHVHIWTSQQYEPALGGSPGLGASLADQRHHATSFALSKWRDGWVASKLHTHPAQTIGLYHEKGMIWWVLAKFLHEKKGVQFPEGGMQKWTDSERITNILKIIKAISLTVERGGVKEENLSPETVKQETNGNGEERNGLEVDAEDEEGLNSMTISFIMERKPASA